MLGDVGTGKTTLSRKLAKACGQDDDVDFHMILNPYFRSEKQFLSRLCGLFRVEVSSARPSSLDYMEAIESHLFKKGVEEGRTMVLLIDEAQILPDFVFETLRILLNYETNEYKILQLVLVGQMELLPRITSMNNFWDRVALKYVLNPLDKDEVRNMIKFRLEEAGSQQPEGLFSDEAVESLWNYTQGYPRKLAFLCHNAMEHLVMHDKDMVDGDLAERVISEDAQPALEALASGAQNEVCEVSNG